MEIHCLLNVNKQSNDDGETKNFTVKYEIDNNVLILEEASEVLPMHPPKIDVGIPKYIASGSHYFLDSRYRFLIMPRYKTDLHSILKCGRLSQRHFLIIASQIIDVLKHLHEKHYVHSDIKAENIMIGLCKPSQSKASSLASTDKFNGNSTQLRRNNNGGRHSGDLYSTRSHNLRPGKSIAYMVDENSRSSHDPESIVSDDDSEEDEDFDLSPRKKKAQKALKKRKNIRNKNHIRNKAVKSLFDKNSNKTMSENDERVIVIDYGLATKFMNVLGESIVHKPFCCDERRAHDGTLEFTSRDAHFGAHSRRSDLECLG